MPEKQEELIQSIQELTTTVKEHKEDRATIDIDALAEVLQGKIDAMVDEKAEAEKDKTPVRKGEWVGPDGFKAQSQGYIENPGKFYGQKMSDVLFAGQFLQKARAIDPKGVKPLSDDMTKLLDATTAGAGDEYVPTELAATLWEDFFLASRIVSLFGTPIAMPSNPFDFPVGWGSITWRKGAVGEATAAQDPATAKSTLTATEQIAEVNWAYDLDEDSVIAVLPTLTQELRRSGAEQMDAFALNADATSAATGNINLDDDTPATDAYYLSGGQDGIRHYYIVDRTGQSADVSTTLTDALWRAGLARMGKYGVDPGRIAAITNAKTYLLSLLSLTNVRTLDKYGPQATILTGELAQMDGIPIVVSASMPLAEDDGKVSATAASNDEGQIALVHRDMWKIGFKRNLLIEVDRDIRKRVYIMVLSFREAIACQDNGDSTTRGKDHTAGIHGIAYS